MPLGGKRAGRPVGTGQYGEPTVPMRLPKSREQDVRRFLKTGTIEPTCPLLQLKDQPQRKKRKCNG